MVNHAPATKTSRLFEAAPMFYFILRQVIGSFGDHGIRSSSENMLSFFRETLSGNSVRRYSKYWYGFKLFALAVSEILYTTALAWAPSTVSITFQFFLLCS